MDEQTPTAATPIFTVAAVAPHATVCAATDLNGVPDSEFQNRYRGLTPTVALCVTFLATHPIHIDRAIKHLEFLKENLSGQPYTPGCGPGEPTGGTGVSVGHTAGLLRVDFQ